METFGGSPEADWLQRFATDWRASDKAGFRDLADALRGEIAAERIRVGTQLPSQRELARMLVLGRSSVLGAYHVLQGESLVRPRRRAGTWVVAQPDSTQPTGT
jgi:DNA-binding FadR family transcriptional regulator